MTVPSFVHDNHRQATGPGAPVVREPTVNVTKWRKREPAVGDVGVSASAAVAAAVATAAGAVVLFPGGGGWCAAVAAPGALETWRFGQRPLFLRQPPCATTQEQAPADALADLCNRFQSVVDPKTQDGAAFLDRY
eukprot:gene6620-6551_t